MQIPLIRGTRIVKFINIERIGATKTPENVKEKKTQKVEYRAGEEEWGIV